ERQVIEEVLHGREAEARQIGRPFRPDRAHRLDRSAERRERRLHGTGGGVVLRPPRRRGGRLTQRRQERVGAPEGGSVRLGRLLLEGGEHGVEHRETRGGGR